MIAHTSQRDHLLHYLDGVIVDHPIEKRASIIALLNSLVDDKKDGKPPLLRSSL